jgi:hypothetical protein
MGQQIECVVARVCIKRVQTVVQVRFTLRVPQNDTIGPLSFRRRAEYTVYKTVNCRPQACQALHCLYTYSSVKSRKRYSLVSRTLLRRRSAAFTLQLHDNNIINAISSRHCHHHNHHLCKFVLRSHPLFLFSVRPVLSSYHGIGLVLSSLHAEEEALIRYGLKKYTSAYVRLNVLAKHERKQTDRPRCKQFNLLDEYRLVHTETQCSFSSLCVLIILLPAADAAANRVAKYRLFKPIFKRNYYLSSPPSYNITRFQMFVFVHLATLSV